MKVQLFNSVKLRMATMLSECGVALDVTFLTMSFQRIIHVGVKRRLILARYLESLLTPVDKPALEVGNVALTLAIQHAMQVLVHHVPLWGLPKTVSVERIQRRSDVSTRITLMVGAVERFVVTCFPAVNTLVRGLVMKGFADLAKRKSTPAATVGKSSIRFYVAPPRRKLQASYPTALMRWTPGLALSSAEKFAIAHLTVGFISARKNVILKIVTSLIVHAHQMWSFAVHAERHHSLGLKDILLGHHAKIPFPIARSHVGKPCLAGIPVL